MFPHPAKDRILIDSIQLRRAEFPWADGAIWLNHAGTSPLPARARRALEAFNLRRAEPFRLRPDDFAPVFEAARAAAESLIHAPPGSVALAPNTSFGLNLAAFGLGLGPGDRVLFSDGEFPALAYPFLELGRRPGGPAVEVLPRTPEGWPDEEALHRRLQEPSVRLVAVSLTQFSTGYTMDLDRLSTACRAQGVLLVVDAIQAVGQMPVDVTRSPVDVLACGAQKWLLSPWGSGFVYVRPELRDAVAAPWAGWMAYEGTEDFSRLCDYDMRLLPDARRFEMPTLAYQAFVAMTESIRLLEELDPAAIAAHLAALHEPVVAWAARRGVPVTSPRGAHGSGILCIAPPDVAAVAVRLEEAGIMLPVREGSLRISPHAYNTQDEMERLVRLLEGPS